MRSKAIAIVRRRIYRVLMGAADDGSLASQITNHFLLVLILLNVAAVVASSVKSIGNHYEYIFQSFELFSVAIFSVEYLIRVWVCVEDPCYSHPIKGRLRYIITPLALIDVLAVLPFYMSFLPADLIIIRVLRVFRLLRIAKIARYSQTLQIFGRVLLATRRELLLTGALMSILLLLASSLMYAFEQEAQPDVFSSIPAAMWWGIATLTTVGYGDIYPVTAVGKFLGSVISIFGIGMFALPTGVLGAAFLKEIQSARTTTCPHCGKEISDNHPRGDD